MNYNSVRIFIVEGETEQHLIKCLKLRGKIKIFNCWQHQIKKIIRTLNKNVCACIVYDTDTVESNGLERFIENVNRIADICYKVQLLEQSKNLEDELIYSSSCSENNLFDKFNSCAKSEFKSNFIKTKDPITLLGRLGFDQNKLWKRGTISQLEILLKRQNVEKRNLI